MPLQKPKPPIGSLDEIVADVLKYQYQNKKLSSRDICIEVLKRAKSDLTLRQLTFALFKAGFKPNISFVGKCMQELMLFGQVEYGEYLHVSRPQGGNPRVSTYRITKEGKIGGLR